LLSLVEVPTRTHRQLGNPLEVKRVPGKINLNNMRDPRVLGALIDDQQIIFPPERDINDNGVLDGSEDLNGDGKWNYGLADFAGEAAVESDSNSNGVLDGAEDSNGNGIFDFRDWWFNFLQSRDGLDPITHLPLPMGGISRPFRDMGVLQQTSAVVATNSSIEDTVLRKLPTPVSANSRRLFELASEAELSAAGIAGQVDPILRHRLLSKIVGNTTTRSNVFVVYVTIGMFECLEQSSGAVRIGGQMDVDGDGQKDTHRAVFIIDRSQAEEAFDPTTGTFDWKKLIKARQRIN
jgi:hypothetical protein